MMKILYALLLLLCSSALHAQRVDTIRANPNAVTLRVLWERWGAAGEQFGAGFGPLGDIFGTGTSAWAVISSGTGECTIYAYDTATRTVRILQTLSDLIANLTTPLSPLPIVGRFTGDGVQYIVLHHRLSILHVYAVENGVLDTLPRFTFFGDSVLPDTGVEIRSAACSDLDRDNVDDLLLLAFVENTGFEIWIYRGGVDFQLREPTIVLSDHGQGGGTFRQVLLRDVTGDHHPDILSLGSRIHVYTVDSTIWDWTRDHQADGSRPFPVPISSYLGTDDCDGDAIPDLCVAYGPDRIALFRSRTGKSWLTRSFDSTDVDQFFTRPNFAAPLTVGPLSDSTARYGTIALWSGGSHLIFSGGVNGPDAQWDAVGGGSFWTKPALDCDGDGWHDYLTGDGHGTGSPGFCRIYAGGPEIPRDPTVGVEWVAIPGEAHQKSIALWPNPARDVVHIAWRGDLQRMPHSFRVHDATGVLVATGSIGRSRGEVVWDCSGAPPGTYLLSIFDREGELLTTRTLLRQ